MRQLGLVLLALCFALLTSGALVAQTANAGDGSSDPVQGQDSEVTATSQTLRGWIAKGKQPASGLVVNVPSGKARVGLIAPEATFVGESEQDTRNRQVAGIASFHTTALGTHVADAAPSNSKAPPVTLVCTPTDKADRVRIDLPQGFDLGVLELVTTSKQRIPLLVEAQAFYLDVATLIELRKLGLERLEMRFYEPQTMKSFLLVFRLPSPTCSTGLLEL